MNATEPIEMTRLASPLAPGARSEAAAISHLRLVPSLRQSERSPVIAAVVSVVIVLAILAAKLGLSIAISQGAYEVRALEIEQRDLSRVERLLTQNVDKLSSPQNLSENAVQLGMVQNVRPAALRLSDGAVLGELDGTTTVADSNLIPNATLENMPVVDESGLLVARNAGLAGVSDTPPVVWKGKLPAPVTR